MEKWQRGRPAGENLFRVLFNVPAETYERLPWRRRKAAAPGPTTAPALDTHTSKEANPWITAATTTEQPENAAAPQPATAPANPRPGRPDLPPWQGERTPVRQRFWYILLRGLVIFVLLAMIITAIRTWFFSPDNSAPPPPPVPAAALYPSAAAGGTALRFAHAYLSWDEANPDARADALAAAGWRGSDTAGWDRSGKQTVGLATVAQIEVASPTSGSITVVATTTPWVITPQKGDREASAKPGTPTTIALRVPIDVAATGVLSIAAEPAYVAVPTLAEQQGRPLPDNDTDLASETRAGAAAFFRAYGADTDLQAITAPGSAIRGLGGALTFERVVGWQVAPPDDDTTQATATVLWVTPDGKTQLQQTYFLILQRTVAGDTGRWQVLTIT